MNFDEAVAYLLSLGHETLAMKLGLQNIERLLAALGNPQEAFPAIQIAGTNGKGSTAVVLDAICRGANIKTGLYTSPHLVSITERIRIAGHNIEARDFARLTTVVKDAGLGLVNAGKLETLPTFFEHITAIALLAFHEAGIELAILETGLGGRLDATTAARARTVALTPIAMDHQEYLGETLAEIASEKAAIIHPGAVVIVGPQPPAALAVIMQQCHVAEVRPIIVDDNAITESASPDGHLCVTFATPHARYEHVKLGLRGRHQVANVALAIAVAESLVAGGFHISDEAIVKGIETA
ncbi:MAG: dihydrofolate synthase / folylpolyglutamate synthase, partial [Blastocatellia bacterium]|nr:dihydrofolate synthase / folylpolyglutamate synthase [Blastocatellia bacterium]